MARSRNIKPGFFKNEGLGELNPLTRILFAGLWCLADREGRLEDRPKRIRAEVLPYDDGSVDDMLNELHQAGFILRYEVGGQRFIQVQNFSRHQNPHHKEPQSTIPAPGEPQTSPGQDLGEPQTSPGQDLGEPQTSPGLAQVQPQSSRADSLNLIPDSLEKTLSGKPDAKPVLKAAAVSVLEYLNKKTGCTFRPLPANIEIIAARLKDGATVDELFSVVDRKCAEWRSDEKMAKYLRPKTLFNRTNFAQYQGEGGVVSDGSKQPSRLAL
jgi:uncharacterized phage protein (TIGR02220 family)